VSDLGRIESERPGGDLGKRATKKAHTKFRRSAKTEAGGVAQGVRGREGGGGAR